MSVYSNGTRVRITSGGGFRDPFSDIWQYENLTGKVLSSNVTDGYPRSSGVHSKGPLRSYKVHLDVGIESDQIAEECLFALEVSHVPDTNRRVR